MMRTIAGLLILAIAGHSHASEPAINEQPLFGGRAKTAEQIRSDRDFVGEAVRAAGTQEAAYSRMIDLGWEELRKGSPLVAIRRFNQAYLIDSEDPRAFDGLGVAAAAQGQFDQAIDLLERAVRMDARRARFVMNLGRARMLRATSREQGEAARARDLNKALTLLDRAIALDSTLADAYVNRAIVRLIRDERGLAAEDLRQAEAIDPKSVDPELKHEILGDE